MLTIFLGHTDLSTLFAYSVTNIYDPLNGPITFPLAAFPFSYSKSPRLSNWRITTLPGILGVCSPTTEKETRLTHSKLALGKWLQKEYESTQLHPAICVVVVGVPSARESAMQPALWHGHMGKDPFCAFLAKSKMSSRV